MKQNIKYYFSKNKIEYIKVFCVFIIGVIISVIAINNSNDLQKKDIKTYIDSKIEIVKSRDNNNKNEIFMNSLKNNIRDFVILSFLSSTIIGIPFAYFFVGKKGFAIGYTISAIYATQNVKTAIIFICNSMILHNIIYMVSMFIIVVSGSNFIKKTISKEKVNFKLEIIKYIIFLILSIFLIIISSLCETYVSNNLLFLFKKYL